MPDKDTLARRSDEELEERIWRTRGARFNAYRRLRRKRILSTALISFLSCSIVLVSITTGLLGPSPLNMSPALLSFAVVWASLFILILSLLESARSYELRSYLLLQSGHGLSRLGYELQQLREGDADPTKRQAELKGIANRYYDILETCTENHEPLDEELFRAQHSAHFSISSAHVVWIYIKAYLGGFWLYAVLALLQFALLLWVFGHIASGLVG